MFVYRSNMKKWKQLAEKSREDVEHELRVDSSERRHSLIQFGEHSEDETSDESGKHDEDDTNEDPESTGDGDTDVSRSNGSRSTSPPRRGLEDEDNDHTVIGDKHDVENVQVSDS